MPAAATPWVTQCTRALASTCAHLWAAGQPFHCGCLSLSDRLWRYHAIIARHGFHALAKGEEWDCDVTVKFVMSFPLTARSSPAQLDRPDPKASVRYPCSSDQPHQRSPLPSSANSLWAQGCVVGRSGRLHYLSLHRACIRAPHTTNGKRLSVRSFQPLLRLQVSNLHFTPSCHCGI